MASVIQPSPAGEERDSNWRPILLGVTLVVVILAIAALLLRTDSKTSAPLPAYAAHLKLTELKMSAAENFVGATVIYLDGTVTNDGDQTVTSAAVHVSFRDSLGQIAQAEDAPLRLLQTGGPYPEAVDLGSAPLAPAQSRRFRLTFEHVTADWNHEYPQLQVTKVGLK
jgi:hypothetical protein